MDWLAWFVVACFAIAGLLALVILLDHRARRPMPASRYCRWPECPMAANSHQVREHRAYIVGRVRQGGHR